MGIAFRAKKNALESITKFLNYSMNTYQDATPTSKLQYDGTPKTNPNQSFSTYDKQSPGQNLYPDYLGYMPRRKGGALQPLKTPTESKRARDESPVPYISLPAISYPVNDTTRKNKTMLLKIRDKPTLNVYVTPLLKLISLGGSKKEID